MIRPAGPLTPHVPVPPFRLCLLRGAGGSDLLPDEYATLDAAARAVPEGGVADVIDAEGFHVGMASHGLDGFRLFLPRLEGMEWAGCRSGPAGLVSVMGQWPGDETEEEVRQALEELS